MPRGKAVWQDTRGRGRSQRGGQDPGDRGSGGAGCRVPIHSKVMGSQGKVSSRDDIIRICFTEMVMAENRWYRKQETRSNLGEK